MRNENNIRETGSMPILEKVISFFKSKHHKRLEDKLLELIHERAILTIKSKLFKKYTTAQIADFIIRKNQLNHDIELLKTILK